MCMTGVNATLGLFLDVQMDESGEAVLAYIKPFDGLTVQKGKDGNPITKPFKIVTQVNLLGTMDEGKKSENIIERRGVLDFIIRITKCDEDIEKRLTAVLDEFVLDTNEVNMCKACFDYLNYTRITQVPELNLTAGKGEYVIKLLVREKTDDNSQNYTIQAMSPLHIAL